MSTVCDLIDSLVTRGTRPALVTQDAEKSITWSYEELHATVRRLAAGLAAAGITPGERVAVLAENRLEWIAAALAAIRCGGVVLPLDTQFGDANLAHALNDSGACLIFTNDEQLRKLESLDLHHAPRLVRLDTEDDDSSWRRLLADDDSGLPAPSPDDGAALFYTSGTTGPPKGVPLSHRNLAFQRQTIGDIRLATEDDRVLLPLPLHHVYPFVIGILVPLGLGLPVILPRSLTGPQILRAIREERATVVIGVPRLFRALYTGIETQAAERGRLPRMLFRASLAVSTGLRRSTGLLAGKTLLRPVHRQFGPSLRLLASGGSALDPDLARKLEGLGWEVSVGYGLTETSPLLTIKLPGGGHLQSVGRPVPGVELKIDPQGVPAADDGEPERSRPDLGEVLARGPNIFRGYWNLPDKSREVLDADGWFRTGDLGYIDKDDFLYLQGRASTLIVTESGKNIQPEEVEEAYAAHPYINEIGVFEQEGKLLAVIVPDPAAIRRSGQDIEAAIRTAVSERAGKIPSYQRLADLAITREALSRTRLGKIRRHLLAERYRQAREEGTSGTAVRRGPIDIAEMSDQDRALVEDPSAKIVWRWLADRYPDARLTPDTSPQMDLGVDSMEWINLTMEIGERAGIELDEDAIARVDTVRDLLHEVIEQAGKGRSIDLDRLLTRPEKFLSDRQLRWFEPLGLVRSPLSRILYLTNKMMMRVLFRVRIRGAEHLPADRQFVLVPNHVSFLDPFAIAAVVPFRVMRRTFFAGFAGIAFRNRLFRFVSRLARTVPIDNRHAIASSLAMGAMVLKKRNNLIWFAEGERSPSGKLQEFKPGIGLLLKHYPADAIPVFIDGAYEALPVHRHWPRLRQITVTFGKPLDPRKAARDGDDPVQERITRQLHARVEELIHGG